MTVFTSRAAQAFLWMLLAIMFAWTALLYQMSDHTTTWNYLYNIGYSLLYFAGGLSAFATYFRLGRRGLIAFAFLFLALSLFSYTAGQWIWTYYNLIGVQVPYPSLADVFFVLFIPFTALSLATFLRVYRIFVTPRVVIESILVFIVATALIFYFEGGIDFSGATPILQQIFNVLYPLTDSILITAALIVIRSSGGTLHRNLILLVAGYLVGALADFTFSYRTAVNIYWNGDIADLLFSISAFLMALAALRLAREFITTSSP